MYVINCTCIFKSAVVCFVRANNNSFYAVLKQLMMNRLPFIFLLLA